ncbi:phosphoenolpyruvate-protein phosphotransferase [Clostridium botulinum C str. Eklund]|nr:phosphoenolpyruvate-protein phosphotransferase [Clostridium botulinum C str. Eklund]
MGIFESMEDEYMRKRAADVKDVGRKILGNLLGNIDESQRNLDKDTIIISYDLTPFDTAQLDRTKVIGFVTDIGGRTSHSAIMARTLEIPAVVGLNDITSIVKNGDTIIVDGNKEEVIINPDKFTIDEYTDKKKAFEKEKAELKKLINLKTVSKSGKYIEICGNTGKAKDIDQVLQNGGEKS